MDASMPRPCPLDRFCYDRLSSLLKTLEVTDTDELTPLQLVADFGTLLGTYQQVGGFQGVHPDPAGGSPQSCACVVGMPPFMHALLGVARGPVVILLGVACARAPNRFLHSHV